MLNLNPTEKGIRINVLKSRGIGRACPYINFFSLAVCCRIYLVTKVLTNTYDMFSRCDRFLIEKKKHHSLRMVCNMCMLQNVSFLFENFMKALHLNLNHSLVT